MTSLDDTGGRDRSAAHLVTGVLAGFLVIGVTIAVGWFVGRRGLLGPHAQQVLSRTSFLVATPALLFTVLARSEPSAQNTFSYAVTYSTGVDLAREVVTLTTVGSIPVLLLVAALLG